MTTKPGQPEAPVEIDTSGPDTFIGIGPRGETVVLTSGAWRHISRKHAELAPHREEIERTLTEPDKIIDNRATYRPRSTDDQRKGDERYVRYSEAAGAHIVVPMMKAVSHDGLEIRAAMTAHSADPAPVSKTFWTKPRSA